LITKRLEGLDRLDLTKVIKKKNPYLFRAKNYDNASDVVKDLMDAYISSSEEAKFGDWLEGLAIHVNSIVYGGTKSSSQGIDLDFQKNDTRYLVAIKSGPNWGNSSQINKMIQDFQLAKKVLRTSGANVHVEFVNGCCYGRSSRTLQRGIYYKYCGQMFWEFISGDSQLYLEIIEPLAQEAKARSISYQTKHSNTLNKLTKDFILKFCDEQGCIDWETLVRLNSSYE